MRKEHKINEGMKRGILNNGAFLEFIVVAVLFLVYIFPQGLVSKMTGLAVDRLVFSCLMVGIFILLKITSRHISKSQILFLALTIIATILSQDLRCLMFMYLLVLEDLLPYMNRVIEYLKKSKILYVCLFFTLFYTILYIVLGISRLDRFAFSAIAEINQSGLAIFCLAVLLMLKNKKLGYITMAFGLLTISRSYYLAALLYLFSKTKMSRKLMKNVARWKVFSYPVLVVISSLVLIAMGVFYIHENSIGNVYWGDNANNRLLGILDYSNLFRFVTNVSLLMIFYRSPIKLFTGLSDAEYFKQSAASYSQLGVTYKGINPHNLFFSHLRMYGLFSIVETWYIGRIIKKIRNENNTILYLIIVAYSVILGAGLYSYWIFLSVFAMSSENALIKIDKEGKLVDNNLKRVLAI